MTVEAGGREWDVAAQLEGLRGADLWRRLRPVRGLAAGRLEREGRELVDFSSNDYLGLASSAELAAALAEGAAKYGAGAGASRLISGTRAAHEALEEALAVWKGTEAALTFGSGYAVALGGIPALVGRGDTILLDKLCHASLVDAARLSGATLRVFPHNGLEKLERLLAGAKGRVLVVTESVFSMDGDRALLREIVEMKERAGAWLWLDEAHAVGVMGPRGTGLAGELGLSERVDLQMGTLSKAAGLGGGYLAARREVVDLLINRARSLIYSTAPPPALAHAAVVALELLAGAEGEARRERLWSRVRQLGQVLEMPEPASAIVPVMLGESARALALSARLEEAGCLVPAIRYPTVARGAARLRITLSASHEAGQVEVLAANLRRAQAELG
ncbi:MAG: 8-amino-7-oxononanoate synthase [Verrucomicrobiales bacterium]|nr:8-amino-7-oxononanoate synthase [Verrucomicrobiales bacterium]